MHERDDPPASSEELENLNQDLIDFVQNGAELSIETLQAFLKSNRLNVVRDLGAAGLKIDTADDRALDRWRRLYGIALKQVNSGILDGPPFEAVTFEFIPPVAPSKADTAGLGISEALLRASDEAFWRFVETGSLPEE
jgi:hypothetical protein